MAAAEVDLGALSVMLFERSDAVIVVVDDPGQVIAVNPAASAALGLAEDALIGCPAESLVVPRHLPDLRRALRDAAQQRPATCELELAQPAGSPRRAMTWSFAQIRAEPRWVACVGVDATAARDEFDRLRNRAITDELTGLPNRAGLLEHLTEMSGSGAYVVFCDLDGFKTVNDTHGHDAGDQVLVQVARRLKQRLRGEDFVGRLGGDEFVIVVPPHPRQDFELLADRLRSAMTQPMILTGPIAVTVGMSIGMSVLLPDTDPAAVLTQADRQMYAAKQRRSAPGITDVTAAQIVAAESSAPGGADR